MTRHHLLLPAAGLLFGPGPVGAQSTFAGNAALQHPYVVDFVASASFGADMNDLGDVTGSSYVDVGCGSTCLPPMQWVVWRRGRREVLPLPAGFQNATVAGIDNRGWVVGHAGIVGAATRAVVWRPPVDRNATAGYVAQDIGALPGGTVARATGIDERGRVVGWSSSTGFPPVAAPFVWTQAGGMVDLAAQGFPNEVPLGISPAGVVATYGFWYRLDDAASVVALPPAPTGLSVENSRVGINDEGDQARMLMDPTPEPLAYPSRFQHKGAWQQLSFVPSGHLAPYGIGGISEAGDVVATVQGRGVRAGGMDGAAESLSALVSPSYGGGFVTRGGPVNRRGEILAEMMIGRSARLVRLVPGIPCTTDCIRIQAIQMQGSGPAYCDQGQNDVTATLTATDESGNPLRDVAITAHFLDDYWMDRPVSGQTSATGRLTFHHVGPPCVGAIAFLITDATAPQRSLDRTAGTLASFVIPVPVVTSPPVPLALAAPALVVVPNPFASATTIRFSLPRAGPVTLAIYDALGREVARLVDGERDAGANEARFDAMDLPGGVYVARLVAGGVSRSIRLSLVR